MDIVDLGVGSFVSEDNLPVLGSPASGKSCVVPR